MTRQEKRTLERCPQPSTLDGGPLEMKKKMATRNTSFYSSLSTYASKMFHSFKTSTGMQYFTLFTHKATHKRKN